MACLAIDRPNGSLDGTMAPAERRALTYLKPQSAQEQQESVGTGVDYFASVLI
jgi:hypothetical protein